MASKLLIKLRIYDAVYAVPVHFFNGMWGCIATGLFAAPRHVKLAYDAENVNCCLIYSNGHLLLNEVLGVLFILGWTVGIMTPFFIILNMLGMFRVDPL